MWGKVRRELMGTPRAYFGVPDTKHPGKGWQAVGGKLPNSNLARSYQLQSSSSRRWNQRNPGLFVYFSPPFWHKEIKANPVLCPPPPSFSSSFLLSLTRLRTKNPKVEKVSPARLCTELWTERFSGTMAQILQTLSDSSYSPHWQRTKQRH